MKYCDGNNKAGPGTASEFYRASGGSIKSVYSLAGPIDYNTIYRAQPAQPASCAFICLMGTDNLYLKKKKKKKRVKSNGKHMLPFFFIFPPFSSF